MPTRMFKKIRSITQSWRLPCICVLCEQYHQGRFAVCDGCKALLSPITNRCQYCALPLHDSLHPTCGHCIKERPAYDYTCAPLHYDPLMKQLICDFKYKSNLYLTSFLSELLIEYLPSHFQETECLIPVPMHKERLQSRGFNHTVELAKQLSERLHISYTLEHCYKVVATPTQAGLSKKERQQNLCNAFVVKSPQWHHVTLIDDLMTTGSTVNELARMLKKSGVKSVNVWCCARATVD